MIAPVAPRRRAPGPRGHWLLGNLTEIRAEPLAFLVEAARAHGDIVRFRLGPTDAHLVVRPDDVRHVLVDNNANYTKQLPGLDGVRAFLGQGLLTSDGAFWLRQRRIAQPAFHKKRLEGFVAIMARAAAEMCARWEALAGEPIELGAEMSRVTLRVVGEALLSTDVTADADAVGRALPVLLHHAQQRFVRPWSLPERVPTPANLRFRQAQRAIDAVVFRMIDERRRDGRDRGDLLSMLMSATGDDGERMTDAQLRDEVMTMFLAGHETTANALTWTWHLLGTHPWAWVRLRAELSAVLNGRAPAIEDLASLRDTAALLHESLRLYPPAWLFGRRAERADLIGDCEVPAGSLVFLSPYITHRHPELWPEPERFRPDRFGGDVLARLPRFTYFPFGGGPRQCIGNQFAMMEATVILAMTAQRFRLEPALPGPVETDATLTLRPRGGLWMRIRAAPSPG